MGKVIGPATALVCSVMLGCVGAQTALASGSLNLGFSVDLALTSGTPSSLPWINRAVADGASVVRVNVFWDQVAPVHRPKGFVASNPDSPGYKWASVDRTVRQLTAHGLPLMLTALDAPRWAEGPHPPAAVGEGSWRPSAKQFGEFGTALARRYDGHFPDPAHPGSFLPRVRLWQAWNEPNLDTYLSPQWTKAPHHGWRAVSPGVYRQLLNAFYRAVKRVSRSNRVFMGGTAPYGDVPGSDPLGQERTPPVAFYRDLFCLRSGTLKPYHCPAPSHLDGLDHHPYAIGGPHWHALNSDDVAIPDIHKITRVLKAALKSGHVLPRAHKSFWVTEFGWYSNPPNPQGVPVQKDARWYELAFYVLWKQGVTTITPTFIRGVDGIYYSNGTPKPTVTAFRFPFITQRSGRRKVLAWGRAPRAGRLSIQVQRHGRWKTLRKLSLRRHQLFSTILVLRGGAMLRAKTGSQVSLTYYQSP